MFDKDKREKEKMSMRDSVFIWVSGAVFGWVLLMVSVYNVVRTDDPSMQGQQSVAEAEADRLNEILPAGGNVSPESAFEVDEIIITPEDAEGEEEEEDEDTPDQDEPKSIAEGMNALASAAGTSSPDSAFTMDEIVITPADVD